VCDAKIVTIFHGFQHFSAQVTGILLAVTCLETDPVKQISSGHEFHNDKIAVLLLEKVNEGNHILMAQRGKDGDLVIDGRIVGRGQLLPKHTLNGDLLSSDPMGPATHCSKGSRFQLIIKKKIHPSKANKRVWKNELLDF
jgi:hypothetical protein